MIPWTKQITSIISDKKIKTTNIDKEIKEIAKYDPQKMEGESVMGYTYPKVLKDLREPIDELKTLNGRLDAFKDLCEINTNLILYVIYYVMCDILDNEKTYKLDTFESVRFSRAAVCKLIGQHAYKLQKISEINNAYKMYAKQKKKKKYTTEEFEEKRPTATVRKIIAKYDKIFEDPIRVYELGFQICAICELNNVFKLTNKQGKPYKKTVRKDSQQAFIEVEAFTMPDYLYDFNQIPRFSTPKLYNDEDFIYTHNIERDLHSKNLITSRNYQQFNVAFSEEIREVLNKTLITKYRINAAFFKYVKENMDILCENGLLVNKLYDGQTIKQMLAEERDKYLAVSQFYDDDDAESKIKKMKLKNDFEIFERELKGSVTNSWTYHRILEISEAILARDEHTPFYFAQYFDFRGRIYRRGYLVPQYNELARGLVWFDDEYIVSDENISEFCTYIGGFFFKHKSFKGSKEWVFKNIEEIISLHKTFKMRGMAASALEDPLTALSISLLLANNVSETKTDMCISNIYFKSFKTGLPLQLDATASAYQIHSMIIGDRSIGELVNMVYTGEDKKDIYIYISLELIKWCNTIPEYSNLNPHFLTRDVVKKVYMTKSYGLTDHGLRNKIKEFFPIITKDLLNGYTNLFLSFWNKRFKKISLLYKFYSALGGALGICNLPLTFSIDENLHCLMKQCYTKMKAEKIRIGYSLGAKLKTKTLTVNVYDPLNGDTIKSLNATAANITHSIDSQICVRTVANMIENSGKENIPIYTNHDNFSTTLPFIGNLVKSYNKSFYTILSKNPFCIIDQIYIKQLKILIENKCLRKDDKEFMEELYKDLTSQKIDITDCYDYIIYTEKQLDYISKFIKAYNTLKKSIDNNIINEVFTANNSLFL